MNRSTQKVEASYVEAIENREPTIASVEKAMGPGYSTGYVKNIITEARKLCYNLPKRGRVR